MAETKGEMPEVLIEPGAAKFLARVISGEFGHENTSRDSQIAAIMSCAMSLKRIADTLENGPNGTGLHNLFWELGQQFARGQSVG